MKKEQDLDDTNETFELEYPNDLVKSKTPESQRPGATLTSGTKVGEELVGGVESQEVPQRPNLGSSQISQSRKRRRKPLGKDVCLSLGDIATVEKVTPAAAKRLINDDAAFVLRPWKKAKPTESISAASTIALSTSMVPSAGIRRIKALKGGLSVGAQPTSITPAVPSPEPIPAPAVFPLDQSTPGPAVPPLVQSTPGPTVPPLVQSTPAAAHSDSIPGPKSSNTATGSTIAVTESPRDVPPQRISKKGTTATSEADITNAAGSKPYQKHPRHWNNDGNIIVAIGGVGYKLHRSRLENTSGLLRRIIKVSFDAIQADGRTAGKDNKSGLKIAWVKQGERAGEVMVPVITLDEVKGMNSVDWERLVDAMDDAITYARNPPPLGQVYSILRASYELRFLSFARWARSIIEADIWSEDLAKLGTPPPDDADPVEALSLGRRCWMPGVAKRAMYELLKDKLFWQGSSAKGEKQSRIKLPMKEIMLLTSARAKLQMRWIKETSQLSDALIPCGAEVQAGARPCVGLTPLAAHEVHRGLVIQSDVQGRYVDDIIGGLDALSNLAWGAEGGFCLGCVEQLTGNWTAAQRETWKDCEELFDIRRESVSVA
ncbi:hypothetical protein DFP72DRAFT_915655 [Ephemerocybe angulata]|uniref:Uncharacterized protein n=1 Tax=Ephemerocybe angulata TaxID=980116 RepID=A0A8H6HN74_9AGAR|nr:hypothetical protein DFP72DRAFT_915655 [Tulosesus angulatus]